MKEFKLLINGKDCTTGNCEYFPYADCSISDFRATRETIRDLKQGRVTANAERIVYAKYAIGDDQTNRLAMEAAHNAFQKFRLFSVSVRIKILNDIRKHLLRHEEEIRRLLVIEGHPDKLARWELLGMKEGIAEETVKFYKSQMRQEVGVIGKERVYWVRKPDGVVCLEPPRNAPCSNSFTAILTFLPGNTLIVKPPLHHPLSTTYLWRNVVWEALKENGAPDGTLNIVIGNSKRLLDEWIESPLVSDIIFFGESAKGLEIGSQIYASGKKPILELSGNDILVVWKDADLESAAESLCDAFLGSTQICMVPKNALVHEEVYEPFMRIVQARVADIKAGLPSDNNTCLTPVIKIKEFYEFLEDAKNQGARIIGAARRINFRHEVDAEGVFIEPTLVEIPDEQIARRVRCIQEETFFPLLPICRITSEDRKGLSADGAIFKKMVSLINQNQFGLRFSLWIQSDKYLRKFVKEVDNAGLFRVNSRHVGFSLYLATHGGTRKSGGPFGEMNYMWQKTSHLQGISRTKLYSHVSSVVRD